MEKNIRGYSCTADAALLEQITKQTEAVVNELLSQAKLKKGDTVVVGCSSSEIIGEKLGTDSNLAVAQAVFEAIYSILNKNGLYLAAQCCEHLNRAIIVERELAEKKGYEIVNVVPQPKAGGSFSTTAYKRFNDAVAIESVTAQAGIDIGGTLIGMHIQRVAVPIHLENRQIGKAAVLAARSRPKFVGGSRAVYNEKLL